MSQFVAEFVGTLFLMLIGNGVVANVVLQDTKGFNSGWIVITTGWAFAVFTGVVIAAPYSGAHINPAVTLGLAIAGEFSWALVPKFILAQMLGAMAGSFIVWLMYKDHFDRTEDPLLKRAVFCTTPAIRNIRSNILSEIIGTFTLIFVIFYVTDPVMGGDTETPIGMGSLGAIPVTFLVWAIGLALGGTTGYAINPARDLGPRIVYSIIPQKGKGDSDWSYSWIPVVAPILGATLAAMMYLYLDN
ncbi:MIP/aquaporin family protein [Christiangramia flava]|uniref:Glycerol uptake facilitator protein n=1 Tax=Christiangramia flava JLT2011 TaxID=1229726 RepID=A0A1L7I1V2_9FLAO|nr:MIP/aquaporin family protein [Christiangramia flava]APU67589.1 Glycerol uptake facilitator protein [Christiangramia flava JLT2011]OSS40174.1 Glycerol uptake facilitator protein [Christiangramia flava JLT2011]